MKQTLSGVFLFSSLIWCVATVWAKPPQIVDVDMEKAKKCMAAEDCIRAGNTCEVNDGKGGKRTATGAERKKIAEWFEQNCSDAPTQLGGLGGVML